MIYFQLLLDFGLENNLRILLQNNDWYTSHTIIENVWTNLSLTFISNGFMNLFINGNLVDESSEIEVSIDLDEAN